MYSTVSGNCKDNSSVYSGSSTNTSNSAAAFGRNRRIIPRSNSTSDLYEIPATTGLGSRRKKQLYASNVPEGSPAMVGSRMTRQTQPWTSRNRSQPSLQASNRAGMDQCLSSGLYRSQSRSNSCYSLEQKSLLKSIPERRQPNYVLTPYQLQRKQMKDPFQFPNGESFTPRSRLGNNVPRSSSSTTLSSAGGAVPQSLSRSQSMNSLPLKPVRYQKPLAAIPSSSTSPVGSGSSDSSCNSMRDHSSSGSTNLSSDPSAHSSNTALPLAAVEKSQFILVAKLAASGDAKRPLLPGAEKSNSLASTCSKSNGEESPSVVLISAPYNEKLEAKKDVKKECQKEKDLLLKRQPESGTKLGAFFKKIFSLSSSGSRSPSSSASSSSTSLVSLSQLSPLNLTRRKKRRRVDADISGSPVSSPRSDGRSVPSRPKLEASQAKAESYDKVQAAGRSTENVDVHLSTVDDENDEDCDDILMDTDLVFDSLLLKADMGRPSYQQKQIELRQKLNRPPHSDSSSVIGAVDARRKQTFKEAESNIDYELISEFSRLGTFIEDSSKADHANLPPRSARRPKLPDKELARSFYHPVYGEADSAHYLIKRLYQDWKVVHLDETLHKGDGKAVLGEKRLRFADEIYVNDTWSQYDYQRSDKRFIKNRRRMMQLEKGGFIQAIKVELNEFKRNEMVVHQESVRFTHLFL
ncbi:hypothetical protein HG536_0H03180 [Torulaspora globosa]|uniref:Uncharacterized protein n=1 Tax=Torulaspora globosa TaxID=48254 RepID=A0A7G3ZN57_9SACH|nr:uncharacterized protein HG536_0H03180 [Torulaspora globosa]QLL34943.1 hypothetical protein HG536_0H03180 [Torulaspora globosa]